MPRWYEARALTPVVGLQAQTDVLVDLFEDSFDMAIGLPGDRRGRDAADPRTGGRPRPRRRSTAEPSPCGRGDGWTKLAECREVVMSADDRSGGTSGVVLSFLSERFPGRRSPSSSRPARGARRGRSWARSCARRPSAAGARGEKVIERGRETAEDAASYLDRQSEALEKRRDRLASAVEAGRQAYRDEKEKM